MIYPPIFGRMCHECRGAACPRLYIHGESLFLKKRESHFSLENMSLPHENLQGLLLYNMRCSVACASVLYSIISQDGDQVFHFSF
jgi:hypothetical protein